MSLLPVAEAIDRIVGDVDPLSAETVAIADAHDRVLAEPLVARRDQPPFPASAMDGYAVRASDATAGARLTVIGTAAAGDRFGGAVSPGEAVRIFTGAPVPPGADTILIQENAERLDENTVLVREPPEQGRHIRMAGLDFRADDGLLGAGSRLTPSQIALAAAMGYGALPVRRRPIVAIVATGDELVPPGAEPGPDQIVSSNSVGVAAIVRDAGGAPHDLGITADEPSALARSIAAAEAISADILVTLGGASVGDHDLVQKALLDAGMTLDFWRIAMRPGKPLMFGRLGDRRVLGLPGNPVSAMVCGLLFLKPLVGALLGRPRVDPTEAAVLGAPMPANQARQDYVRARFGETSDGRPLATPLPVQDSAMLTVLAEADCLIVREPHAEPSWPGDPCQIIRLRGR
ncbi:gephyrin-like molybdotransferase Glp [Bauldia sp.]|uniref:molybdopterin molybdotransferase MoeA n=1 Tax=Bauldia sp. TaxID=2575872 RepID=UPI003BAC6AEC